MLFRSIEGAKDPDEFIVKYGPERFQKYVETAISLVEYKVKILKSELNLENVNDKIKFLNQIAKILSTVGNKIEKEVYIEKIALDYQISKEAIHAEINKIIYSKKQNNKILENKAIITRKVANLDTEINEATLKREKMIIFLLINYPEETYNKIKNVINIEDIRELHNREIIKKLYEQLENGNSNSIKNNVLEIFQDEELTNILTGIMVYDFEVNEIDKCIDDVLNNYEKDSLILIRNSIIKQLENTNNLTKEEVASLEKELNNVIIKLARIK